VSQVLLKAPQSSSTLARKQVLYSVSARRILTRGFSTPTEPSKEQDQRSSKTRLPAPLMSSISNVSLIGITSIVIGGGLLYILYENDYVQPLPPTKIRSDIASYRQKQQQTRAKNAELAAKNARDLAVLPFSDGALVSNLTDDVLDWASFTKRFASFSTFTENFTEIKWAAVSESITDFIVPEWARGIPEAISKLQFELSMEPGSLADEIWKDARDPYLNPEITQRAAVRVSDELCNEEKAFIQRRKKVTTVALAKYLGLPEESVHPDDVPTIAMIGSGGGLRACVAGTGSLMASKEAGLFDCVTYTAGVSGSCWLQAIYNSSISGRRFDKVVDHLKSRIGIHIAYPPVAFSALNSVPTNKFLLAGFVEKLKGDPTADFGLTDIYGLILAARLLVPKGELGVDDRDLKISNQRDYIAHGENPMPIYTAVRHEIPILDESSELEKATGSPSESTKQKAKVSIDVIFHFTTS